jgi:DNA-binding transcriptional LysR family regulator
MELRQLEYFVAVVEEANFTRAAERVHVAQPGVSAQIRRLERELGQPLLDRSGRTVRLTEVGAAVLPFAKAALAAVDGARLVVDELAGLTRGRVAAGMVTSGFAAAMSDLLADFHRDYPAVEITLIEANSDKLLSRLQNGELDLALVGLATPPPAGIETQVLVDERLVAAVGREDPLYGTKSVTLEGLRERDLICLPQGTGLRASIDGAFATTGFSPKIAFEAGDPSVLAQLAVRGLGVAILPESLGSSYPELHALAITKPRLRSRIELAWRADGPVSPAARALIDYARAALAKEADQRRLTV